MKRPVVIYDDSEGLRRQLKKYADEGVAIAKAALRTRELTEPEFLSALGSLESRVPTRASPGKKGKQGGPAASSQSRDVGNWIDQAGILVLDYDLRDVQDRVLLNGELVSYFARCYSNCGLIVSVNPVPVRAFDLRLRHTLAESWADVGVFTEDLSNPGLWSGKRADVNAYRPWYWPVLPALGDQFETMVAEAKSSWTTPIFDFFDVPDSVRETFPKDLTTRAVGDPRKATFKKIAEGRVRPEDAQKASKENLARIAASTVHAWLESTVLPGQHVLIDAPHLVSRYPKLLKGSSAKVESWNRTCDPTAAPDKYLGVDEIARDRFKRDAWISRPVWWVRGVSNNSAVPEVKDPGVFKSAPFVFAEDTSSFHSSDKCQSFALERTPYARRYVRRPDLKIAYEPAMRLALQVK